MEPQPQPPPRKGRPVPLWVWLVLAIAILGMSSGGVWFALLPDTPAILKSAWRLGLTSVMQLPFFLYEWRFKTSADGKVKFWQSWKLLVFTGLVLGLHFAAWSWSVNTTSLSHSLLFVCSSPILLIGWTLLVWAVSRCRLTTGASNSTSTSSSTTSGTTASSSTAAAPTPAPPPPTLLETTGTLIGFLAAALLAFSAGKTDEAAAESAAGAGSTAGESRRPAGVVAPSLKGDLWALFAAAMVVFYLKVGARMRTFLPLFVYAFPVTATAASGCLIASLLFEDCTLAGFGAASVLGFLGSWPRFAFSFGAAMAAGILGHTGANLCLEYVSPLVISINLLFEPLLGSLLGFAVGLEGEPDLITLLCGPLLMFSAVVVTVGDSKLPYSQRAWDLLNNWMPCCGSVAEQLGLPTTATTTTSSNAFSAAADIDRADADATSGTKTQREGEGREEEHLWTYHDPSAIAISRSEGAKGEREEEMMTMTITMPAGSEKRKQDDESDDQKLLG